MTKAGVQVQGVNALAKALKNADDGMDDALKAAHLEGAELVAAAARPLVPHKSGALRGTVRASATLRSGRVRAGKTSVPYAAPIHFGWGRRGIHPSMFLYDALERRKEQVLDVFLDRIEDLADQVTKEADGGGA